jgi:membrane-associated phospholipid phosphatase
MQGTSHTRLLIGGVLLLTTGVVLRYSSAPPGETVREAVPVIDVTMRLVTQFGTKVGLLLLLAFMARYVTPLRRWALLLLIPAATAVLVTDVVKQIVRDPRPVSGDDPWLHATGFAFPSGHATAAGVIIALLVLHRSGVPVALTVTLIVISAGSVMSRLWFGVHQVHDILAGLGVGLAVTSAVSALLWRHHRVATTR